MFTSPNTRLEEKKYFMIVTTNTEGNCSVLHCASILRTIFASLARAHGRVRVQNVRDFPQTSSIEK